MTTGARVYRLGRRCTADLIALLDQLLAACQRSLRTSLPCGHAAAARLTTVKEATAHVITVSPAKPGDAAAIVALLEDLDRCYGTGGPEPPGQRLDQVNEALFTSPPASYALLARDARQVAGLAAYSLLWPAAGATRSLFLKELYVPEAYRRRGIGKLLMRAVFDTAVALGCSRVEWTTDAGNTAAQAFYARLGLPTYPSKVFYRVEDTGSAFESIGS